MAKAQFSIRVERDRSTEDEWIVTKYHRTGWTVLFRGDLAEAHDYAQNMAVELDD